MVTSESERNSIENLIEQYNREDSSKDELVHQLESYARLFGFINNTCRKQTWNLLTHSTDGSYSTDENLIEKHQYYEQVRLDVIRTLKRFPPNYSDSERGELQDELILIIVKILIKHEELHYYQGYHDICLTFLLVLGERLCLPIMDSITMSHLKYFMEPTMERTREELSYLMPLINCINSECAEYMEKGGIGHVIFALPWFITWYSHVLEDLDIILRLYDLFIVSHHLMPIYVAAEIVNYYSDEVLSKDCEMSSLHFYLSNLPTEIDSNNWEDIIKRALYLFESHPPDTLDQLNQDWKIKCEYIERSPVPFIRRRPTSSNQKIVSKSSNLPSKLVFWGTTIAVGGLAIILWNQSQFIGATKLPNVSEYLAQLYR